MRRVFEERESPAGARQELRYSRWPATPASARIRCAEHLRQTETIHFPRHYDIGEDQIDPITIDFQQRGLCIGFCSASRRSVISRVIFAKPMRFPKSSRMASITTLAQKKEPSLRTRQPSSSYRPVELAMFKARAGRLAARSESV